MLQSYLENRPTEYRHPLEIDQNLNGTVFSVDFLIGNRHFVPRKPTPDMANYRNKKYVFHLK